MRHAKFALAAFLFLILASAGYAEELNPFKVSYAKLKITATKDITASDIVSSASLTSYDLPQDGVISKTLPIGMSVATDPEGNGFIRANWSDTRMLVYDLEFIVESDAAFNYLRTPPPFPIPRSSLPSAMDPYLKESHYVKITPEIAQKALEITSGSKNSFEAAARLTDWVHGYVTYDLAYGDSVMDSSWVFANKVGVCDEYSNLLIAMLRSVGIPARYASGLVYGGIAEKSWQSHAWVEAYLGGEWVPFDPTYGEIGYVDATHVRFSSVIDAYALESKIEWMPSRTRVSLGQTSYSVEVLDTKPMPPLVGIASIGNISAWPGASIGIYADVTSAASGCIASDVTLALYENKTNAKDGFSLLAGSKSQLVIVCPGDSAELGWVAQAPDGLAPGYTYYYDSLVYDHLAEKKLRMTLDPMAKKAPAISARIDKPTLALGEIGHIRAEIRNTGVSDISGVALFTDGNFQKKSLYIRPDEAASVDFYFKPNELDEQKAIIYAPFGSATIAYSVVPSKSVRLKNVSQPEFIRPGGSGKVQLLLENLGPDQTIRVALESGLVSDELLASIAAYAELGASFEISIPNSTPIGIYPANVSVSSKESVDKQSIDIMVYEEPSLLVSVDFSSVFAERGTALPVTLINNGRSALKNIAVSISATGATIKPNSIGIELLEPGTAKTVSLEITPGSPGENVAQVNAAYEDGFRSYTMSKELGFDAKEAGLVDIITLFISGLLRSIGL